MQNGSCPNLLLTFVQSINIQILYLTNQIHKLSNLVYMWQMKTQV